MWSRTPLSGAFATTSHDARAARLAAGQWSVLTLDDLAAVLACGPYAVLSHYSAAALQALVRWTGGAR